MRNEMIGAVVRRAIEHPEFRKKLVENPQANGMQLFFAGKLKVTGNQMLAMKLPKLFEINSR